MKLVIHGVSLKKDNGMIILPSWDGMKFGEIGWMAMTFPFCTTKHEKWNGCWNDNSDSNSFHSVLLNKAFMSTKYNINGMQQTSKLFTINIFKSD